MCKENIIKSFDEAGVYEFSLERILKNYRLNLAEGDIGVISTHLDMLARKILKHGQLF
jgi:hypothetical protein